MSKVNTVSSSPLGIGIKIKHAPTKVEIIEDWETNPLFKDLVDRTMFGSFPLAMPVGGALIYAKVNRLENVNLRAMFAGLVVTPDYQQDEIPTKKATFVVYRLMDTGNEALVNNYPLDDINPATKLFLQKITMDVSALDDLNSINLVLKPSKVSKVSQTISIKVSRGSKNLFGNDHHELKDVRPGEYLINTDSVGGFEYLIGGHVRRSMKRINFSYLKKNHVYQLDMDGILHPVCSRTQFKFINPNRNKRLARREQEYIRMREELTAFKEQVKELEYRAKELDLRALEQKQIEAEFNLEKRKTLYAIAEENFNKRQLLKDLKESGYVAKRVSKAKAKFTAKFEKETAALKLVQLQKEGQLKLALMNQEHELKLLRLTNETQLNTIKSLTGLLETSKHNKVINKTKVKEDTLKSKQETKKIKLNMDKSQYDLKVAKELQEIKVEQTKQDLETLKLKAELGLETEKLKNDYVLDKNITALELMEQEANLKQELRLMEYEQKKIQDEIDANSKRKLRSDDAVHALELSVSKAQADIELKRMELNNQLVLQQRKADSDIELQRLKTETDIELQRRKSNADIAIKDKEAKAKMEMEARLFKQSFKQKRIIALEEIKRKIADNDMEAARQQLKIQTTQYENMLKHRMSKMTHEQELEFAKDKHQEVMHLNKTLSRYKLEVISHDKLMRGVDLLMNMVRK